jgi:hypothetical protein
MINIRGTTFGERPITASIASTKMAYQDESFGLRTKELLNFFFDMTDM